MIYQQLWIRDLQHFFGSTIHSITTVVAAYMGGLGLGAWFMGRRADRHPNPALLYGVLEIALGVFGLASPWLFGALGSAYLTLARVIEPGLWTATLIKFVVAFIVLLVPTFLMGGTLPILTRAFAGEGTTRLRRELALFYGLNTLGAVVGCAVAGYVLVEYAGIRPSIVACGLLNIVLGAVALKLAAARAAPAAPDAPAPETEPDVELDVPANVRSLAIWLIGLTAFASLLYEIAWTRVLVLLVGSSTYAFTTILACFLLGIGFGSLIGIGKGVSVRSLLIRAALVQGAIALLAAILFPFFRALPRYIIATLNIENVSSSMLLVLHGAALAVVIIPPAIGMGLAFPLLTELAARRGQSSGTETGRAYLANTIGSILGAALTGFLFIHTIGAEHTLEAGVLINIVATTLLMWHAARLSEGGPALAEGERPALLLALLALIITVLTPSWSNRLLDRGPAIYGHGIKGKAAISSFLRGFGAEQLRLDEGWNSTVSVWRNGSATWLKSNGKADASSVADMNTQVLVGALPVLAHPRPSRVFVIGFGSGATARSIADVQGVDHLDVVEIERAVIRAADLFSSVNGDVLRDPRVRLIEDDARGALQLASEPYDVIVSEPSNPWIAGIASLYTPEFFQVAKDRLAEDGIFAQWVQTYRVPVGVVSVVVANMRQVFPHVEMWYSNASDLILLASRHPITWSEGRIAAHLDTATAAGRSARDWLELRRPSDLLGRFLLGDEGTRRLAETAPFTHRDDHPRLEFVAARGLLAMSGRSVFDSVLSIRRASGDSLPRLNAWPLSPGEVRSAFARALPASATALSEAELALTQAPNDPERSGVVGTVLFERQEYRASLPHFTRALQLRPGQPDWLLRSGIVTVAIGDIPAGRALLERALAAGGDSVYAMSVLAEIMVGQSEYQRASELATRALRAVRPTIAMPFPAALETTVRRMSTEAPPPIAAALLEEAMLRRPGWDVAHAGAIRANVRWGGTHCRRAAEIAEELDRFGWTDSEIVDLIRGCGGS